MGLVAAIVAAAGEGKRFGRMKQYVPIKGKPVLEWSLERLASHRSIAEIVLVLRDDGEEETYRRRFGKISAVVCGGKKRQDSVQAGFDRVAASRTEIVLVHDGVRPLISTGLIDRVIAAVREKGAAVPAVPVEDTLKRVENGRILETVDRRNLCRVQTPQGFRFDVLKTALDMAKRDGYYGTDEAALVERAGYEVAVVPGEVSNIKITGPDDIKMAEAWLES